MTTTLSRPALAQRRKLLTTTHRCLTCRRRKTRCAGERPLCSTCTKNGHECLGYPEDKREGADIADTKNAHEDGNVTDGDGEEVFDNINGAKAAQSDHRSEPHVVSAVRKREEGNATVTAEREPQTTEPAFTQPRSSNNQHAAPSISDSDPLSPTLRRSKHNNRVPYFRYFGPTAIVPGFKQMVV